MKLVIQYCLVSLTLLICHAGISAEVYFNEESFTAHLNSMTESTGKENLVFRLGLYSDNRFEKKLPAGSNVKLDVIPRIPVGTMAGKQITELPGNETIIKEKERIAKSGCRVSFDSTKSEIIFELSRPEIFVDPTPGKSSNTWHYEIIAVVTTIGSGGGGGGGIDQSSSSLCVSGANIILNKDVKIWNPSSVDNYTYTFYADSDDHKQLGIFKDHKYEDGTMKFFWGKGTEGRSIRVRFHIAGDNLNTFEDTYTDWQTLINPCTKKESIQTKTYNPKPKKPTPAPQTREPVKPQNYGLSDESSYTNPTEGMTFNPPKEEFPAYSLDDIWYSNPQRTNGTVANLRAGPSINYDVIFQVPQDWWVIQTGDPTQNGITNWYPVRVECKAGNFTGYISDLVLKRKK